jgi:hypothetical protein
MAFPPETGPVRNDAMTVSRPTFFRLLLGLAIVGLAGCESEIENAREQVTGDYPVQTRTFPADVPKVYAAARAALKDMGFHFTHGGQHQGEVDGMSAIAPGEENGSSQQFGLKAHLEATLDGKGTEVTVSMTRVIEPDTEGHPGQGVESPLRDTALYEAFFEGVQRNLGLAPAPGS